MNYVKNISQNINKNIYPIFSEIISDLIKIKKDYLFLFVISLGIILRLIHLSQPIKGDETATFLYFVEPINPLRAFVYSAPNNHVFHTILTRISTFLFGNSVVALRIPSLLASIGIIYFVYAICKKFGQNGIFAAISTSFWPFLIAYSNNSRGYSLFCLLSLFLVYSYLLTRLHFNKPRLIFISFISSLGIYTIPTFVIFVFPFFIWISIDNYFIIQENGKKLLKLNLFLILYTFFFSILLYLPVFLLSPNGVKSVLNNKAVNTSLSLSAYINQFLPYIKNSIIEISQLLPNIYLYLVAFLLFIGIIDYFIKKKIIELSLFPLIVISSILIISIKLVQPPGRTWIFLIPYFLILADNGFSRLITNLKHKERLFLFLIITNYSLISINTFLSKDFIDIEEQAFPESKIAVKYLESQRVLNNKDELIIEYLSGDSMPLNYYNWLYDAKISVNSNRIYKRKKIIESLKEDLRRFLNSEFQTKMDGIKKADYYILNNRYGLKKDINLSYQEFIKMYPLKIKAGKLEIYSAKKINSNNLKKDTSQN